MFQIKTIHFCAIGDTSSKSFLPPLPYNPSIWQRLLRYLKKLILITERNPRSSQYFRSTAEIIAERRKQVASKAWVIHPFSTFRLYYEMHMAIILCCCLIYMPFDASFKPILKNQIGAQSFLDAMCWIDILITFSTGYRAKHTEEIIMKRSAIAKRYVLSIYCFCDVCSSIPGIYPSHTTREILCFLGMLKIIRMGTFIKYAGRTCYYYKKHGVIYQTAKLLVVIALVNHYMACLVYLIPSIFGRRKRDLEARRTGVVATYIISFYKGAALLLSIDIRYSTNLSWFVYLLIVAAYFCGKIIITFVTVFCVNMLKNRNSLENKYSAMMSQVDAYMEAKKIPRNIQKRMREYYLYKYRQKYFKETSIKKFMSDKLKREINYQGCRKLVQNVKIFEKLPQRIVEDILTYMKVEIYLTSDIIIQAGSQGDCMYFIASGTVAVLSPSGKEICHLEDGAYFGEIALVSGIQKRSANVIAIEICEVYKLDRRSFKKCMEFDKELYKKIQQEAKMRLNATQTIESSYIREFSQLF